MTQVRIKNTREVFPIPQGSVLIVTPSRSTSAGRVTLNTSGVTPVGPWTVAGGASMTIGPFTSFVDLTVESTSGTVFAEVTSSAALTAAQGVAGGVNVPALDASGNVLAAGGKPFTLSMAGVTVAMFGDSLHTLNNQFIVPTSMTRASGVVTVNYTSHGLATGSKIRVFGIAANTDYHTADAAVTRIDANNFSYPSPGADGTATLDPLFSRVLFKNWFSNVSCFQYANSVLRGALVMTDNFGQSGETTTQMLARVAEVTACSADVISYLGGSNDIAGATTAATTIANDLAIVTALVAAGKHVVVHTLPPLGTGHAAFATGMPKLIQVNAAKRALAQTFHGRVRIADYYAAVVNPATGGAKTNVLQSDNIHWQTYGARLAGAEFAAALTGVPVGRFLTKSIADARATYATSPNIWPVGQFTQTDLGTKSGPTNAASPPGGSVAGVLAGYNVTATAGAGEVWMVPDDDGFGYGQVCSWTPSGSGSVTIQQQSAATMAAMVAAGEVYRIGFHLKVTGVTSALTFLRCRVQGVFGGTTVVFGSPHHSMVSGANNVFTDFDHYIVGPEMIIPPGACTSITVEVIAQFTGATTMHTITVERMTFDKVR